MSERDARDYEDFDHMQILSPLGFKPILEKRLRQLTYDCSTMLIWDTISRRPAMMSFQTLTDGNFSGMLRLLAHKCRKYIWMPEKPQGSLNHSKHETLAVVVLGPAKVIKENFSVTSSTLGSDN